jgi:hypothetical protein
VARDRKELVTEQEGIKTKYEKEILKCMPAVPEGKDLDIQHGWQLHYSDCFRSCGTCCGKL